MIHRHRAPNRRVPGLARRLEMAAAAAALLLACGEEPAPPAPVVRPVKMVEFASDTAATVIEYPARVQAAERSELAFEVAGRIVAFPVKEGQRVARGDVLARLDDRDFVSRVEGEKSHLAAMKAEFDRMKALFEADVASKQQYDKALRDYEVAQRRVETASKALEDSVLRAPFDGIIGKKLVDDFANVQAKEPVVSLQGQSREFEVVVDLPEQDALRVQPPGQEGGSAGTRSRARVIFPAYPDREFPLTVKEFAAKADPVTRTFRVTAGFVAPEDLNVMAGMTAKVRVDAAPGSALARADSLPMAAVQGSNEGGPYVWVADPKTMVVSRRPVELGAPFKDRVEIRSGLAPGELVVVSGIHQMRDGLQVSRLGK